jgi:short-subunit dehydrogenase
MTTSARPLAVVTGASSGIGYHLALLAAENGHDLVVAADQARISDVANDFEAKGAHVIATVHADLASTAGVDKLMAAIGDRPVAALFANAGHGLGHGFLDQEPREWQHVINTNITGTIDLVQRIGKRMRAAKEGRILFTGSIAGVMPGTFQAVYNASKAFIDSFAVALRNELKNDGVSVTVLMPGPVETEFFERADMMDTKVGAAAGKSDPADVAKTGYDALMAGDSEVVAGWKNKLQAMMAHVTPDTTLAQIHRGMAEPGSAKQ